nr:BET1-like protein isoform X1 [Marmota flaviventris]
MADWTRAQNPGAVEEILDRENKRMADSLASKVTRLKSLALDIDRDAEDQNRYLDGMDSDFTSMTGLLTGSMKRFSTMARSGRDNRKLLCDAVCAAAFQILRPISDEDRLDLQSMTDIHKVEDRKNNHIGTWCSITGSPSLTSGMTAGTCSEIWPSSTPSRH